MRNFRKVTKILGIILVIVIMSFMFMPEVNAENKEAKEIGINDIVDAGKNWIKEGENSTDSQMEVEKFAENFIGVGQVLVAIGIVTLLIVSLITAIKWITATPDKQAKLKQQLIGLVISAVVIFGAIGIWNLVRGILQNVEGKL
nr:hypothetical protein [Clostridia bacterium]